MHELFLSIQIDRNSFTEIFFFEFVVLIEGRKYSHDLVDMTGINVMLNTKDVSEYLKISPNGLEVNIINYTPC